ncbi:MAG: aminoacyl--tRNA ligase-related protein [Eggerthellaceae bacterium]
MIRTMQEWLRRDLYERGYEEVITPHVYNADVWKTSGHYGFYKENMYFFEINEGDDENPRMSEYGVKPMNCPGHVMFYKNELHSYRDLPLRYFEFGTVYPTDERRRARPAARRGTHPTCSAARPGSGEWWPSGGGQHIATFGFPTAEISTRPEKASEPTTCGSTPPALKKPARLTGLRHQRGDSAFYVRRSTSR